MLAVADEVVDSLWTAGVRRHRVDLVLAAGDLPLDYLEFLSDALDRPCVLVPGNHDADLSGYSARDGMWLRDGVAYEWPRPAGWSNADGRVVDVAGLRIAGLGGSIRYNDGPNQWTERQQARRARRLARSVAWRRLRDGRDVDVLLTHAPARGVGDAEDPCHRGFDCLHDAVRRMRPKVLVHGHIHPYGNQLPDRRIGDTLVVNTVGFRILDIDGNREGGVGP